MKKRADYVVRESNKPENKSLISQKLDTCIVIKDEVALFVYMCTHQDDNQALKDKFLEIPTP